MRFIFIVCASLYLTLAQLIGSSELQPRDANAAVACRQRCIGSHTDPGGMYNVFAMVPAEGGPVLPGMIRPREARCGTIGGNLRLKQHVGRGGKAATPRK